MGLNVEDVIAGLDPERRHKIKERAAELIAEEMTLRELRKARQLTRASVAREPGIRHQPGRRLAAAATQRPVAVDAAPDGGGDGRQPLAHRPVSRPAPVGILGNCRARDRRLPRHRPRQGRRGVDYVLTLPDIAR